MDLAFTTEEHQHIAGPLALQFGDGVGDGLRLIASVTRFFPEAAIAGIHGIRAARDFNDRSIAEVLRELLGIDGGRGDDHFEIGPAGEQLLHVTQQKVDVEAAFVGLIDDEGVIGQEQSVTTGFGQKNAVGHHFDECVLPHLVTEADGESNGGANFASQFLGDAL